LLTLEDTVEFFNLIIQTGLNEQEKKYLVAFIHKCALVTTRGFL
jgi:hypothetical protein